jgi:hypothetical protein
MVDQFSVKPIFTIATAISKTEACFKSGQNQQKKWLACLQQSKSVKLTVVFFNREAVNTVCITNLCKQAKFAYRGSIFSSSQFLLLRLMPQNLMRDTKIVKYDLKNQLATNFWSLQPEQMMKITAVDKGV